jgi:hypothetical protein
VNKLGAKVAGTAFVTVYDESSSHLLVTSCTDNSDEAADVSCAVQAAKRVYDNTRV